MKAMTLGTLGNSANEIPVHTNQYYFRFVRGGILGQLFGASRGGAGSNGHVDHPVPCADQYFQHCHFQLAQYRGHECHHRLDVGLHLLRLWCFGYIQFYYTVPLKCSIFVIYIITRLPKIIIESPSSFIVLLYYHCRRLRVPFVAKEEKLPEKASPSQNE